MSYLDYGNPFTEGHGECFKCEAITYNGEELCECCKEEEEFDLS